MVFWLGVMEPPYLHTYVHSLRYALFLLSGVVHSKLVFTKPCHCMLCSLWHCCPRPRVVARVGHASLRHKKGLAHNRTKVSVMPNFQLKCIICAMHCFFTAALCTQSCYLQSHAIACFAPYRIAALVPHHSLGVAGGVPQLRHLDRHLGQLLSSNCSYFSCSRSHLSAGP